MFAETVAGGLRWARRRRAAWLVEAAPRYHPDWADSVLHVPLVREVLSWNLMMVLQHEREVSRAGLDGVVWAGLSRRVSRGLVGAPGSHRRRTKNGTSTSTRWVPGPAPCTPGTPR